MEDRLSNMEEFPEPLKEPAEDFQEFYCQEEERRRKVQELLDRAAELLAPIQENRRPNEKPC